jgi:hypothetical protein
MVRKTRTIVPKALLVETRPPIRIALPRTLRIRIVGKNDRTIARLEITQRRVAVFGAREWKAKGWKFEELQLEGISEA